MVDNQNNNFRLKIVREALNFHSKRKFAQSLEMNENYYGNIERGREDFTYKLIMKLIEIHNVSADWLLTGKGSMFLTASELATKEADLIRMGEIAESGGETKLDFFYKRTKIKD